MEKNILNASIHMIKIAISSPQQKFPALKRFGSYRSAASQNAMTYISHENFVMLEIALFEKTLNITTETGNVMASKALKNGLGAHIFIT